MNLQFLFVVGILVAVSGAGPTLVIEKCPSPLNWNATALISSFTLDIGKGSPSQLTQVHVCYDNTYIYVRYDNIDNNIYSIYKDCNDDLFNQDVVEMFIAPASLSKEEEDPYHYIEIEASPNGVLFVSNITNYSGNCSDFSGDLIPCDGSGVVVNAQRLDDQNKWWAIVQVPFTLLSDMPPFTEEGELRNDNNEYRVNFFRIDQPQGGAREFSCWSPTFASPPCFHVPHYFGTLILS